MPSIEKLTPSPKCNGIPLKRKGEMNIVEHYYFGDANRAYFVHWGQDEVVDPYQNYGQHQQLRKLCPGSWMSERLHQ
jgi:hypothetical protein